MWITYHLCLIPHWIKIMDRNRWHEKRTSKFQTWLPFLSEHLCGKFGEDSVGSEWFKRSEF